MERLYKMAQASNRRFPDGVEPFQMATRLLEECGEVAAEINLWEDSGVKRQKHGEPKKEDLAAELRQAMTALADIALYYGVEQELEASIAASLRRSEKEGLLPAGAGEQGPSARFPDLAGSRYSVRKFSGRPVEPEKLEAILQAGRLAPTACNKQPQRVLAIRSPEALERLNRCTSSGNHFGQTLALLVCYDKAECWVRDYDDKTSGEVDASIAATHMMLAAHELGIGSTWVMHFIPQAVREEFALPDTYEPVALLMMGYAAEGCRPSPMHGLRKEIEETVYYY